ncbi:MAG: tRNA (cytidine(34)-2'-O)-methyltransferase [Proteobacteria bacterium]|nr:MAG: tRNA (cytidine(34)-2'-O)-methyltransferase [Pseudomonadota bacterium]
MVRVVLVEPLIPENTGNVARTCVGTESELHLVEPMAFEITESRVKRAGLDYWPDLKWQKHASFADWRTEADKTGTVYFVETTGETSIYDIEFQKGDWLVFGKETSGLTESQMRGAEKPLKSRTVVIPMPGPVRSFNLSNSVAIVVFEALRQIRTRFQAQPVR